MIIMSVDYGDVRTGIAVSDRLETYAFPVEVINEPYQPKVISRIQLIASEKKPEIIVVGYPKNMDSTEGSRAQRCKDFSVVKKLRTYPVFFGMKDLQLFQLITILTKQILAEKSVRTLSTLLPQQ